MKWFIRHSNGQRRLVLFEQEIPNIDGASIKLTRERERMVVDVFSPFIVVVKKIDGRAGDH